MEDDGDDLSSDEEEIEVIDVKEPTPMEEKETTSESEEEADEPPKPQKKTVTIDPEAMKTSENKKGKNTTGKKVPKETADVQAKRHIRQIRLQMKIKIKESTTKTPHNCS